MKKILIFILLMSSLVVAVQSNYISNEVEVVMSILPTYTNLPPSKSDCNPNYYLYTTLNGDFFTSVGQCSSYLSTTMCHNNGWKLLNYLYGYNFTSQGDCVSSGGYS